MLGHKNPETDSICSAIAYAHLKNETSDEVHVPARLGELTAETAFVLDHFGVDAPVFLPHVRMRVGDVMTGELVTATPETPVKVIGELMAAHNIRAVPIVDDERLAGIVSERDLARRYLADLNIQSLDERAVSLGQIAEVLDGRILLGAPGDAVCGRVLIGAMRPETMAGYIKPGDVVVVGDRDSAQRIALESGARCLIVTGGFDPAVSELDLAGQKGAAVVVTPHDTYAAARLINLSVPARHVMNTDVATASPDDLLAEVVDDVLGSANREVVVTAEGNRPIGIVTRTNLVRPPKRRVILVDHNERSQAADGIDEARVLEIVDHHRLGDIETADPILVTNEPVGATATIVAYKYRRLGVEIPAKMAGILMAAILSDTVLLKSPTATEADRTTAAELSRISGEDWEAFGGRMFEERAKGTSVGPAEIVAADLKTYYFGDAKVGIAQVETVNAAGILEQKRALTDEMNKLAADREYDTVALMITDIIREGTELLVAGKTRMVERAFDAKLDDGSVFLPGVISRKKQVVSVLMTSARS